MTTEMDLFACGEGVHALHPEDILDPAGTACRCGAISLIGVMAAVKGDRKLFLAYLIDTTPAIEGDEDAPSLRSGAMSGKE